MLSLNSSVLSHTARSAIDIRHDICVLLQLYPLHPLPFSKMYCAIFHNSWDRVHQLSGKKCLSEYFVADAGCVWRLTFNKCTPRAELASINPLSSASVVGAMSTFSSTS